MPSLFRLSPLGSRSAKADNFLGFSRTFRWKKPPRAAGLCLDPEPCERDLLRIRKIAQREDTLKSVIRFVYVALIVLMWRSVFVYGQSSSNPPSFGRIEVGGHVGAAFDLFGARPTPILAANLSQVTNGVFVNTLSLVSVGDGHDRKINPMLGGNALFSLTKNVSLYGDFEWVPTQTSTATAVVVPISSWKEVSSRYFTMGFGGVQFTLPTVTRVVPYFLVGGGGVFFSQNVTNTIVNVSSVCPGTSTGTCSVSGNPNGPSNQFVTGTFSTAAAQFGGGIRYFIGERWGLKAGAEGFYTRDALVQHRAVPSIIDASGNPLPAINLTRHGFGQVEVGLFKQFR
jgi:hypothetical protein